MLLEIGRAQADAVGTQTRPGFVSTCSVNDIPDGDAMDRDAPVTTDRTSLP